MSVIESFEYFDVVDESSDGAKTRRFAIVGRDASRLGVVRWYGPWRRYCFFPESTTVWSDGCLGDVRVVIDRLHRERRAARSPSLFESKG